MRQHLVPRQVHPERRVTVLSAPKNSGNSRGVRGVGSQIHVLRARNPSITLTGHDDAGHLGRVAQAPHHHAVERRPQQRRQHAQHHQQRDRRRPAPPESELPVGERGQHGDGPVGEVEDARRGVGDDQARGRDAVHAPRDQAEDRVLQERVHGSSPFVARLLVLGRDPVLVELGLVDDPARQLDRAVGVAVNSPTSSG